MMLLTSIAWHDSRCEHIPHHKFLAQKSLHRLKNHWFFHQTCDVRVQLDKPSKPDSTLEQRILIILVEVGPVSMASSVSATSVSEIRFLRF